MGGPTRWSLPGRIMDRVSTSPPVSSESWLRTVVESLREIVWVHDPDGTVTYCSPSARAALGYSPAELRNTNECDLIHPSDLAIRDAALERLLATNEPQPAVDLRLRKRDGSFTWFEVADTDLVNDPVVHAIVTTGRDVNARKATADVLI